MVTGSRKGTPNPGNGLGNIVTGFGRDKRGSALPLWFFSNKAAKRKGYCSVNWDYSSTVATGTKQTRLNSSKPETLSVGDGLWLHKRGLLLLTDGRQEGDARKIESQGRREMRSTRESTEESGKEEIMPLPCTLIPATVSTANAGSRGIREKAGGEGKKASLELSLRPVLENEQDWIFNSNWECLKPKMSGRLRNLTKISLQNSRTVTPAQLGEDAIKTCNQWTYKTFKWIGKGASILHSSFHS